MSVSFFNFAFELRYDEEPNAQIGHVRFCKGWAINWPWNKYCDTSTLGNGKETGNTIAVPKVKRYPSTRL